MEQKEIGGFIVALRKAKGLTQKELAEALAVSDKSVSRWERGEGLPDLALIPVIAEFFDVTCDELLAGGRKAHKEPTAEPSPRGAKQMQRLLDKTVYDFKNKSFIAYGLLLTGLCLTLLINCGFLRALIALFVGMLMYGVAMLCMVFFMRSVLHTLATEEFAEEPVQVARLQLFRTVDLFFRVTWLTFASVLFPLLVFMPGTYQGLYYDSVIGECLVFLVAAQLSYEGVLEPLLWRKAVRFGVGDASGTPMKKILQRGYWKLCASGVCSVLCALVGLVHFGYAWAGELAFVEPLLFDDKESFVAFMAQEGDGQEVSYSSGGMATAPEPDELSQSERDAQLAEGAQYFDENGNQISKEQAYTNEITAPDGTVLFTYVEYNTDVTGISYSFTNGETDPFPIRVTTDACYALSRTKYYQHIWHCVLLYPCMASISVAFYYCVRNRNVPTT